MKSARVGISIAALLVSLPALAASCGPPTEPPHVAPVQPVQTAAPAATPSGTATAKAPAVDPNDPEDLSVAAWTDDLVVQALAKDCHWDPKGCVKAVETIAPQCIDGLDFATDDSPGSDARPLPPAVCKSLVPLACAQVPGQVCAQDECSQHDYDCVPKCDQTCGECAGKCVTSCESCKAPCKDDACRLACAKSCGECRQSCLKALDHCATAQCQEEGETCFRTRDDEWNKSTCPKVCPKVEKCVDACPEKEDGPPDEKYHGDCAKKCLSRLAKGCPSRFHGICTGNGVESQNFYAYHANRNDK
jgi:hypothetical protein